MPGVRRRERPPALFRRRAAVSVGAWPGQEQKSESERSSDDGPEVFASTEPVPKNLAERPPQADKPQSRPELMRS